MARNSKNDTPTTDDISTSSTESAQCAEVTECDTTIDDTSIDSSVQVDDTADTESDECSTNSEDTTSQKSEELDESDSGASETIESTFNSDKPTECKFQVKSTNRLMKVYAHANEKSKCYSFIGTYRVTGVMCSGFKQIVCNVPGIGKFTGYIRSK